MPVIDASSIIHAWDSYPPEQFPPLWTWIEENASSGEIKIAKVNLSEVERMSPDCAQWIKNSGIEVVIPTNEILRIALTISTDLNISNGNYHPKGVDENDLIAIATAKHLDQDLVSDEAEQAILPLEKRKYKIPAACKRPIVSVRCLNFLRFIKDSKVVFG